MSGVSYSAGAVVGGGFLRCRGCGGRGLWVLIPIFSPPPSGFPPGVRRVLLSYTPLGSIGLTHGSIGLTRCYQVAPLGFGGSTQFLVRGRVVERFELGLHCYICLLHMALNSTSVATPWGSLLEMVQKTHFPLPREVRRQKTTILSHLRILGGGRGYTAAGCEPAA